MYLNIYIFFWCKHYSGLLFPLEVEVVVQARGLLCRLYLVYVRGGWVIYLRNLPRPPWCAGSKQYCARSHHQSPVPADSADGGPSVFSLCLWRLGHLASEPSTPAPCPPWCAGLKPHCARAISNFLRRGKAKMCLTKRLRPPFVCPLPLPTGRWSHGPGAWAPVWARCEAEKVVGSYMEFTPDVGPYTCWTFRLTRPPASKNSTSCSSSAKNSYINLKYWYNGWVNIIHSMATQINSCI